MTREYYFNIAKDNNKIYYINPNESYNSVVIPEGCYELNKLNNKIKKQMIENGDAFNWYCPIYFGKPSDGWLQDIPNKKIVYKWMRSDLILEKNFKIDPNNVSCKSLAIRYYTNIE